MAVNIITTSNSRTIQVVDNEAGAYLLVAMGAYVVESRTGFPAYYHGGGTGTIDIDGRITAPHAAAIFCIGDNGDTGSGGGNQITVSASGVVSGQEGVRAYGGDNSVINAGLISSHYYLGYGIVLSGNYNHVTNGGEIDGATGVRLEGYGGTVINTGAIHSAVSAIYATGNLTVRNSGDITGDVQCEAILILHNTGTINGDVIVQSLDAGSYIENDGTIAGKISTAYGADFIVNAGMVSRIYAGEGNDSVDNRSGIVTDFVFLDAGADHYVGGDHAERVYGGTDADDIDLGGGNDVYFATNGDGKDTLDGGDGVDRYDASEATQAVTVDLGAGTSAGTVNVDVILNFENVTGGSAADTLTGDDGANRIDGGLGADKLDGGTGNDRLIGGTGIDTITGGAGRDVMTGGLASGSLDSDTFVFTNGSSGATAATRDVITDFTDHGHATAPFNTGADLINLSAIDANTAAAGNQAFSFNAVKGAAFSGAAGSLIWQQYATHVLVSGDTNGDGKADFVLQLNGTHTLFASDFVL